MEEEYKQVAVYYAYATLCECRFAVLPDDDEIQHSIPTGKTSDGDGTEKQERQI